MAVKYTLTVESQKKQSWLVEIDFPSYTGESIALVGDRNPILLEELSGGNDNPFDSHILTNSLTIRVYDDLVDIEELQLIDDASVRCRAYLNGQLKHQGFIISDGIQENDSGVASLITIKSIDGLELLGALTYKWGLEYGAITVNGQLGSVYCPLNIIRRILIDIDYLNNPLPIRWASSLKSVQYPLDDMLAGRNKINADGYFPEVTTFDQLPFYVSNSDAITFLSNILKTAHCWLYQRDGYWWIENRGDTMRNNGFFNGFQIPNFSIPYVATPISVDLNTTDLALEFIDGDQYWMVKKPLGGVNVVYEDTTNNNNVIPNGGFDVTRFVGAQRYARAWRVGDDDVRSGTPINGRPTGWSANVDSTLFSIDRTVTFGQIPLDTSVLFKNALLGFKWLPVSGYELTGNGNIDFSKFPIWISARLSTDETDLYLNEFGYWSDKSVQANAEVANFYWTGFESIVVNFVSGKDFFPGDEFVGIFTRNGQTEIYVIEFDVTTDLISAIQQISSKIPNSNASTSSGARALIISGVNTQPQMDFFTQKIRDYYKQVQIDGGTQMKLGDILDIQFQSKGLSSNIKLPSRLGKLSIEILAKGGSQMFLDDAYFRVDDNHDKYEIRNTGSKSPIENYDVGISSSFSGHMWSNYMDSYSESDLSLNWTIDGTGEGRSLTQLYGEFIMDWRNTPRKIFDGSIDRIVQAGDFLTIKGRKYVVMNATIQGDGITRVLAFEAVLNPITYNVEHKGTIENNN